MFPRGRARVTGTMFPKRPRRRGPRAALAGALTAAVLAVSAFLPATAASAIASPATSKTATSSGVTVTVSAGSNGILTPNQALAVTAVITNDTPNPIEAGQVQLSLTTSPLADRSALNNWLSAPDDPPASSVIGSSPSPVIGIGSSTTVNVTVPAANLPLAGNAANSVYGLSLGLSSAGKNVASGLGSLVWQPVAATAATQRTGIAVAVPITVPAASTGLISSDDLATYTASDGILTRELDAVSNQFDVAVGIDPMIIASIRVLGSSAPATATEWLTKLADISTTNDTFPLQYGDADVAAEVQSGVTKFLTPTSFDYALDSANFRAGQPSVGETVEPTPATPTPTPTTAPDVPDLQHLLAWNYTLTGIAWPGDDTVRAADLPVFAQNGLTATVLSGSNTNASGLKTTPSAAISYTGGTGLVADETVSADLRTAVNATNQGEWDHAVAALNAQLALVNAENASPSRVILATLGRDWASDASFASQALSTLDTMAWVQPARLSDALHTPPTAGLSLKDAPESGQRIESIGNLLTREKQLGDFSSVLKTPATLTGKTRNDLLALLGVGWLSTQNDWPTAAAKSLKNTSKTLGAVQISPPDNVNLVNNQGLIPITVTNELAQDANISLHVTPSNGRIEIDNDTTKTIPAGASAKVLVPVKAKVGNGKVQLSMQLYSPTGVVIGFPKKVPVDVHADWEGIGAVILGALLVLFFGFGLVRSILRRRRERAEKDAEESDESAAVESTEPDAEPAGTDATETVDPEEDDSAESSLEKQPDDEPSAPEDPETKDGNG